MLGLLMTIFLVGGIHGKIQGTVLDENAGMPLPYATVLIMNTELGASTDENGNFFILNVPPGRYIVKISSVGYQTKLIENVIVEVDQIERLRVGLLQQPIELAPVTVTSETPPIKKEMIGPTFSIKKDEILLMPIDHAIDVITFQPSVVHFDTAIHVRGGRANEVLYLIDNVSIVDPQTGDMAIVMSKGILDEVIFLPGGFDVEYGKAMSGVINVLTARPKDQLHLKAYAKTERIMPFYYDFGFENYQALLHLPVTKQAKGYFSFDVMHTDDWDPKLFILPHKARDDYSLYGKWQFSLPGKVKLTASGAKSQSKFDRYNSRWKFRLDHYRSDQRSGDFEAVNFNYLPDPKFMFNLTLSRLYAKSEYGIKDSAGGLFDEITFKDPGFLDWPSTRSANNPFGVHSHPFFYAEGDYPEYQNKSSEVFKSNITGNWQIHKYHEFKAGLDYSLLDLNNLTVHNMDSLHSLVDNYSFQPKEFSCFVQDNVDYKGMFIKAGVRFDHFKIGIDTIKAKMAVSPRIGFSYMVTDKFLLRTNFGQYTQPPLYDQLYSSLDLLPIPAYLISPPLIGNPDLNPEKTRSFEIGLQGEVKEDIMITVNTFFKDVTDLLGTRLVYAQPKNYVTYYNVEAANIKGVETILDFKYQVFTGKVSYTLSYARGTSSYAEEIYSRYYHENLDTVTVPPATDYFLDFDQRHRIFIQGIINMPMETKLWLLGYFGNGFPYSQPGPEGKLTERNILHLPFNRQVDCALQKPFKLGRFTLSVNLEVINLLDARYNIAPVMPEIPDNEIQPSSFNTYYTVFNKFYHPAADFNHDGIVTPGEYFEAFRAINLESEDWPNCYTAPRRARIGIAINI